MITALPAHASGIARWLEDWSDADVVDFLEQVDRHDAIARALAELAGSAEVAWFGEITEGAEMRLNHLRGNLTPHLSGLRVTAGRGLTGKSMVTGKAEYVRDYFGSSRITHDFDRIVAGEQVAGMLAVPVSSGTRTFGVLTLATRGNAQIADVRIESALTSAQHLAETLRTIDHFDQKIAAALASERERVAASLHDDVGARVFGLEAQLVGLRDRVARDPDLVALVDQIALQAGDLNRAVRDSIRDFEVQESHQPLHLMIRADLLAFERRTAATAELLVLSEVPRVDTMRAHLILTAIREALLNVEKHAHASKVIVSVCVQGDALKVAVMDNGLGPDPSRRPGHGLASLTRELGRMGGTVSLHHDDTDQEAGTALRLHLPLT